MRTDKALLAVLATLGLAILSCNIGIQAPTSPSQGDLATIVAMTLQAVGGQVAFSTPAEALTPLASGATFTAVQNTNCRSGPSTNYEKLAVIPQGTQVQITARDPSGKYFIVNFNGQSCWVLGDIGTVAGNPSTVPQVTPDQAASSPPSKPGSLFYNFNCAAGTMTTVLNWKDSANNEAGYRVFRYDVLIADLPPNSSTFTDEVPITIGTGINFSVEAYNAAGASPQRTVSFNACK